MTDQARLKAAILATRENAETIDSDAAWDRFATAIAAAVIVEIKAAKITYTGGLAIPNVGVVAGVFNNTIS